MPFGNVGGGPGLPIRLLGVGIVDVEQRQIAGSGIRHPADGLSDGDVHRVGPAYSVLHMGGSGPVRAVLGFTTLIGSSLSPMSPVLDSLCCRRR